MELQHLFCLLLRLITSRIRTLNATTTEADLAKTARGDMDGFVPCTADQERLDRYNQRIAVEKRNRAAILEGAQQYDSADLSTGLPGTTP